MQIDVKIYYFLLGHVLLEFPVLFHSTDDCLSVLKKKISQKALALPLKNNDKWG